MIRRAIVNVAVGSWYADRGSQRLFDSLEERGENSTRLFWRDHLPPGCPSHTDAPYAFKPYAFKHARELGFDHAVWLDASCWALKPLDDIWARIHEDGYYLEPDGHIVGEWIGERALELLQITRGEAMLIPLIEGKLIGLDLKDDAAGEFLDEWLRLADRGGFHGAWTNEAAQVSGDERCRGHRHDIACASPVAYSLGFRLQPEKRVGFPENGEPGDSIVLMAQGM